MRLLKQFWTFYLFYDTIFYKQKAQKEYNAPKGIKGTKTVLNRFFFFMIRFYTHKTTKRKQDTKKHSKYKNITKQKHKNAKKWTKIKNVLKKHVSGKKSLIHLFV